MTDAWRRAGRDDVAGLEAHESAQVADEELHAEDHRLRRPVLIAVPVDFEPQAEILTVGDFVGGHEPGTNRPERVGALALHPLAGALELIRALGQIVDDAEAGDVRHGVGLSHVLGRLANHDAQFDFPVALLRAPRQLDVVVGTANARRRLHEDDRLGGDCHVRLGGMIRVVEANANEFADTADAGPNPCRPIDGWERR